jgi:hypothetical protein
MSPLRWDVLLVGFVLAVPVVALGVIGQMVPARVELAGFAVAAIALLVPTLSRLLFAGSAQHDVTDGGA